MSNMSLDSADGSSEDRAVTLTKAKKNTVSLSQLKIREYGQVRAGTTVQNLKENDMNQDISSPSESRNTLGSEADLFNRIEEAISNLPPDQKRKIMQEKCDPLWEASASGDTGLASQRLMELVDCLGLFDDEKKKVKKVKKQKVANSSQREPFIIILPSRRGVTLKMNLFLSRKAITFISGGASGGGLLWLIKFLFL